MLIILIILAVLFLGGGGYGYSNGWPGHYSGGIGIVGIVVLVLIIALLFGGLGRF